MENKELSGAERVNPYDDRRAKSEQVEEMFDSIAPAYDFMNNAMTFGLHRHWRNTAIRHGGRAIPYKAGFNALDVATGTGDVALYLHKLYPNADIVGVDISEGMLKIARDKLSKLEQGSWGERCRKHGWDGTLTFSQGDSLHLDFPDDSFDLITVAYGVRNFEHLEQGLRELERVLKPCGVICIIELSEPETPFVRSLYRFYSRRMIPAVGKMASGDKRAYSYLPESIAAAPQRRDMAEVMKRAGFVKIRWKSLTFGAVTYYLAEKGY